MTKASARRLRNTIIKLFIVLAGVVLLAFCALNSAHAKWNGESTPELEAWYKNQHNEQGQWCCDKSDGHPYYGNYKFNEDGSVILDNGHKLPAYMVLKGSNPTGHSVWWFTDAGGEHRDYCFAPGALG